MPYQAAPASTASGWQGTANSDQPATAGMGSPRRALSLAYLLPYYMAATWPSRWAGRRRGGWLAVAVGLVAACLACYRNK